MSYARKSDGKNGLSAHHGGLQRYSSESWPGAAVNAQALIVLCSRALPANRADAGAIHLCNGAAGSRKAMAKGSISSLPAWLNGIQVMKARAGSNLSVGEEDENCKPELAELVTASALDAAQVSLLQLGSIQTRRVAPIRRLAQHVCAAASPLHVLLASLLLVFVSCSIPGMRNAPDHGVNK